MNVARAAQIFEIPSLQGHTADSLKKIYHRLAGKCHPDKGGSAQDFINLRQAYTTLKEALRKHTPFEEDTSKNRDGGSTSSDQYQRQTPNFEVIWEKYNDLQSDYQDLYKTHQRYDQTFNIQIQVINRTVQKINELSATYNHNFDSLKQTLDQNLSSVEKQHNRTWWQYVVPVPKISQQEYVARHNNFVESYNTAVQKLNTEYNENITRTYQHAFETFVELIKNV